MVISLESDGWVPRSCTLPTAEQPIRVAEFDRFFADSVLRTYRPARTRLDLLLAADTVPAGRDLAAREAGCCSFFAFTFDDTETGPVMHVDVPDTDTGVLDAFAERVAAAISTGAQ